MQTEVAGREDELRQIHDFIDAPADAVRVLVLDGEAGIGKTTLWAAGVERARQRGYRVLVARPAEREQGLALAGLGDLLEEGIDDVLPLLAAPRRQALTAALLQDGVTDAPLDPRALAVGVRDVLHLLSERERVLVAVDDVQWLDASSAAALTFALRRVTSGWLIVLLSRRRSRSEDGPALEVAFSDSPVTHVRLDGLSVGALHRMLRDRLGRSFPHQTMLRIHERSGGNPFFTLELGRAVGTDDDVLAPLTVPVSLENLLRARLTGLPPQTRQALAVAVAVGKAPMRLLERAGVSRDALDPALAGQVVVLEDGVLRFTHPMLSSVLYAGLGPERTTVHARIAEAVDDPVERARHVALSTEIPNAVVADQLEAASGRAASIGAPATVAELAEHAARLTPDGDAAARRRRALTAARAHQAAGEWTRARAILASLLHGLEHGAERAEMLVLLAELESVAGAAALLEEALKGVGDEASLRAVIECRLAWARRLHLRSALDHARSAVEGAEQVGDDLLLSRVRAVEAVMSWFHGDRPAPENLVDLTSHLPAALGGDRLVQEGTQAVVNTYAPAALRPQVLGFLEQEHRRWSQVDEPRSARAVWGLAWVEFWAGRWPTAYAHALESLDISTQYGIEVPQDHLPSAVIAVHRGELEVARRHSRRGLALAQEQFGDAPPPQHLAVLGLADLWSGDRAAALSWLDHAEHRAAEIGWGEPSVRWWTGDLVELLLGLGRVDDAHALLERWEADAVRVCRPWVLGHVARGRGLLAAATGDVAGALTQLSRAVTIHDEVGDPYGRARALLALGVARRRERQKTAAREAIHAALTAFAEIGATGWADRSRAELGGISGRRRVEGLTAAEQRVADLVAAGRTNREVAATLFLGERTVASHLTHIYAKLGVRSRTELARLMRSDVPVDAPWASSPMSRRSDDSKRLPAP